MSAPPLVSVVMATYHWPEALALSIPSVIAQSYPHWELLVVGDGCSDQSESVVASFADPRIRWFNLPQNSGSQGAPNNFGIEQARGELIAYLGHDDLWAPEHLQTLLADYHGQTDFFAAAIIAYFDDNGQLRKLSGLPSQRYLSHPMLSREAHTPSGMLHSRALVLRSGPWADWRDLVDWPDEEFFMRMAAVAGPAWRSGRVSVAKIPAGWRQNSYATHDVTPQRNVSARMATDTHYLSAAALVFLLSCQPSSFPALLAAAGWRCRQLLIDYGARRLKRLWLLLSQGRGGRVRRGRRYRGLDT